MSLTSKSKLAEQAYRIIAGGTDNSDRDVRPEEISLYIEQCFAMIVKRVFFEGKAEGEAGVNGEFVYSFDNQDILKDSTKGMYYTKIPSSTVGLPNDIGYHFVGMQKNQEDAFVRVPNNFSSLYKNLGASTLEGRQGYFIEANRLYYPGMDGTNLKEKVLLKLIVPLGSVDDEAEVNIPLDIQHEIVQMSVEMYAVEQGVPTDLESDNVK
jgi:hypothetical protein